MAEISTDTDIRQTIDDIYQAESRRVFASLIRLLGDFDLAEDALQDAYIAALQQWPTQGVPNNPRAWLVSTGRFKAIDGIRRRARFDNSLAVIDTTTRATLVRGASGTTARAVDDPSTRPSDACP